MLGIEKSEHKTNYDKEMMHNGLRIVGGSLLAAWLALNPTPALTQEHSGTDKEAQTAIPNPIAPATEQREAWLEAGRYAKNHPVVAFSIRGHAKDATSKQIGEFIKQQFEAVGIPSVYYTQKEDSLGVAITFFLKDMAYGPSSISGIQKNMNTVASHFSQAWPDFQAQRENSTQQLGHEK